MPDLPVHRAQQTGNPVLDRIQNNVRALIEYLKAQARAKAYVALTTDVTQALGVTSTLVALTITTTLASSYLLVHFSASSSHQTNPATNWFTVRVDGQTAKGCYSTAAGAGYAVCSTILVRVPVKAGAHVVDVQWTTDNNTARISAKSRTDEHATLHVVEEA